MTTFDTSGSDVLATLQSADRLLVQQVFRPIGNEYRISVPAPGERVEGEPILFVKQKKLAVREDIRFRTNPDSDAYLFMIKSKSMFEFRGRHDVFDASGTPIGQLAKDFGKSLLRSHWTVSDASGAEIMTAQEQSLPIALIRRFAGYLPIAGAGLLSYLPFNFTLRHDGVEVGTYGRVIGAFRDRYVLNVGEGLQHVDRRLLVAFMVALDALQDR